MPDVALHYRWDAGAGAPAVAAPLRVGLGRLSASDGLEWIHGLIGELVAAHDLEDLVLVVEDQEIGRQVFRTERRPLDACWAAGVAQQAMPGIHTRPHLEIPPEDEAALLELCRLMLELDLTRRRAARDALTGLLNRGSFDRALERAIQRSRRYGWEFTLVVLDVDDFKELNDSRGHVAGDAVLREIGRVLFGNLRAGDVAARIGGDEFAVILEDVEPTTTDDVLARLHEDLAAHPVGPVTLSAGVVSSPREGIDAEPLLALADQRLYESKRGGR